MDDLFAEIEKAYDSKPSLFDTIDAENDFIMAFFLASTFGKSDVVRHEAPQLSQEDQARMIDYMLKRSKKSVFLPRP